MEYLPGIGKATPAQARSETLFPISVYLAGFRDPGAEIFRENW
jgi:hypothetical protein